MGETDEKDTAPPTATEKPTTEAPAPVTDIQEPEPDPKETEKLLGNREEKSDDKETEKPTDEKKKSSENVNGTGEEIINIPEESANETAKPDEEKIKSDKPNKVQAEEREVKPKKVPAGAFKLPGFFNKNKGKEADGADNELLEKQDTEKEVKPAEVEEKPKRAGFFANLRLRNPFAKKPAEPAEPEESKTKPEEEENDEVTAEATDKKSDEGEAVVEKKDEETAAQAPKKGLLDALKVPLASIIPKRFKSGTGETEDDLELGKRPKNQAGLASMETLDDSLKDTEQKDTVDKAAAVTAANGTDSEALVKPEEKKDTEKEDADEQTPSKYPCLERIRNYKCSVDDIAIITGIFVFLLLLALIIAFTFIGKGEPVTAPVRDGKYIETVTSCGKVEGILEDGAFAFRGIPYAVPPLGPLRWKAAQPIENINYCWNETLKAHNSTPVCWQFYADGKIDGAEDCLTLDVITPHVRYDNPLPVVVLIGAESFTGDSPGKLRPSTRYARARDVIFVRPNFRLNVFGFLTLEQLTKTAHPPTSGNYGLSDIIAALKWVQLNIAHFGGDPKSVTLFGHRAGGTVVAALASSNKTTKLFARSWISSAAAIFPGKPLSDSEKANAAYLGRIKCTDATCLREKEDEDVLDAVPDTWRRVFPDLPSKDENTTANHEWLSLDGRILQQHPADVWSSETGMLKYVIGTTAHESHSEKLRLKYTEWTPELVTKHVNESMIGKLGLTSEAIERYNATYQGLVSMISDIRTVCPLLTIAQKLLTSQFYVVTQTGGELNIADVDSDIQAILGRYEPKTPEQRRYVSAIQQLFYHYVSHGEIKSELRRKLLDIGQDALPTYNTSNCDFWIKNDVVPRYARLD
ncbi:neurotactin [Wyeomyia smithii]|uniref:neurotactin n=1 Tax=Wyeomyia smithii TaxID=174621 RepID=UPI002467E6D1|nr:neurotactin [Wyeomyia smithii]XP_055530217.1 neurotactin [Wyeomyia smithii]